MAEYKSTVHVSPFPQQRVYDRLSDLTFLTLIQNNLDNPEIVSASSTRQTAR